MGKTSGGPAPIRRACGSLLAAALGVLICGCAGRGYHGIVDLSSQGASDLQTVNLAAPESWGRWTDGSPVAIRLDRPLPPEFRLKITINQAFGPNVGKPVLVTVGNRSWPFTATAGPAVAVGDFEGVPEGTHIIRLTIPAPTSPKSLGISADSRELGLALARVEVAPLN